MQKKTLLAALLSAALLLSLSGCGRSETESLEKRSSRSEKTEESSEEERPDSRSGSKKDRTGEEVEPTAPVDPEEVRRDLTEAIAALTSPEETEGPHLLGLNGEPLPVFSYEGGAAVIAPYVTVESGAITGEGAEAEAALTVTSPDVLPLVTEAVRGMEEFDEDALNESLAALLEAGGYAATSYEVTVTLRRIDGEWYLEENEALENALSGGLLALEAAAAPQAAGGAA